MSGWKVEHTTLEIVRGILAAEEVDAWEITAEGQTVAYIPDTGEGYQRERADLMAAAPELADALEATVQHVAVPATKRDYEWHVHGAAVLDKARAALKLAGRLA